MHPKDWTAALLSGLTGRQLVDACLLMGIAHSGAKERLVARLLAAARVRTAFSESDDLDWYVARYSEAELRGMARSVGVFCSIPKIGVVAALLNWRNKCRSDGARVLKDSREVAAEAVSQSGDPEVGGKRLTIMAKGVKAVSAIAERDNEKKPWGKVSSAPRVPAGEVGGDGLVAAPLVDVNGETYKGSRPAAGFMQYGRAVPDGWPARGDHVEVKGVDRDWVKSGFIGADEADDDGYTKYEVRAADGKLVGKYHIGSLRPAVEGEEPSSVIDGVADGRSVEASSGSDTAAIDDGEGDGHSRFPFGDPDASDECVHGQSWLGACTTCGRDEHGYYPDDEDGELSTGFSPSMDDAVSGAAGTAADGGAPLDERQLALAHYNAELAAWRSKGGQRQDLPPITDGGDRWAFLCSGCGIVPVFEEDAACPICVAASPVFEPAATGKLRDLPVQQVHPSSFNPRKKFDQAELQELAESIKQHGLIEPIVVRPCVDADGWEIVAGERRWRAHKLAGLTMISAIIRPVEDIPARVHAILENLERVNLNPIEEASGYKALRDLGMSVDAIAQAVGRARTAVSNSVRLLGLPIPVLEAVECGALTESHGRALLRFADFPEFCLSLADLVARATPRTPSKILETNIPHVHALIEGKRVVSLGYRVDGGFPECRSCPLDARFNSEGAERGLYVCLRPDHYAELEAARAAETAVRLEAELARQRADKEKQLADAQAKLESATTEKERGRAKQAVASVEGALKAGIPDLAKLNSSQYQIKGSPPPSGCSSECPCHVLATRNGTVMEVCLNSARYQQLTGADTRVRNSARRERFTELAKHAVTILKQPTGCEASVGLICERAVHQIKVKARREVAEGLPPGPLRELLSKAAYSCNDSGNAELRDAFNAVPVGIAMAVASECLIREELLDAGENGTDRVPLTDYLLKVTPTPVADAEQPLAEVSRETDTEWTGREKFRLGDRVTVLVGGQPMNKRHGCIVGHQSSAPAPPGYRVSFDGGEEMVVPVSSVRDYEEEVAKS